VHAQPVHVCRVRAVLEVVAAGCSQDILERCRPILFGPGELPGSAPPGLATRALLLA
jgi:hypothetical protein